MSNASYTVHNEVLLTKSGTAFLIGGNHSVLNYITQKTKPKPSSFENFKNNISRRAYLAHVCKSKYLHVIFPDKQSVLRSEFPIANTVRLGDLYTESLNDGPLNQFICYPTEQLQKCSSTPYQKLDTHLSDAGSLVILEQMLIRLEEPVGNIISEIKELITSTVVSHGDLGGKFDPPLTQESTRLKPNWNYRHYNSGGTFNNGQIDIYLAPNAPVKKKVLIFGDSFYRLMLVHLSRVFTEITFLRTPYLHTEMIELIKPDIILTGNAERYLADVAPDTNAPAFQLYSYTHNATVKPSPLFINAFRAITSPMAAASRLFFSQIFDDRSQPKLVVGPSHIVRWGQHLKHSLIDRPNSVDNLIGYGGAPIWSQKLYDSADEQASLDTKVLLMVGDFRFGNEICLHPNRDSLPLFLAGPAGIKSAAIGFENDEFLLKRCKHALLAWNNRFNNKICFLFWDLFCRQVQDRLAGRHIVNRQYVHPNWNLAAIQKYLPPDRVADLTPLLALPMHEVMRLFIDGSSHPSHTGYLFIINSFIYGSDTITSYNKAIYDVNHLLFTSVKALINRKKKNIAICGRSSWLDTLMRYLGPDGVDKCREIGLSLVPFNPQIGHSSKGKAELVLIDNFDIYLISENGSLSDLPPGAEQVLRRSNWSNSKDNSLAWELNCASIISNRNETPRSLFGTSISNQADFKSLELDDADVELGPFGYPSIRGILKVLELI